MTEKATTTTLLNVMSQHQGADNGIRADHLAAKLGIADRTLRKLISTLRNGNGYAICGQPSTGYYVATTPDELRASCAFLEHRALHSLRVLSRMRNVSMPDLMGQLLLNQA